MSVQCTNCEGKWFMTTGTRKRPDGATEVIATCPACGFERNLSREKRVRELRRRQRGQQR